MELEESSEFLEPVDRAPPVMVEEDAYQTLEDMKTVLHSPYSNVHFAYNRVPWTLKIRKEVFSPSESINSPLAINLIFSQVSLNIHYILICNLLIPPYIKFEMQY